MPSVGPPGQVDRGSMQRIANAVRLGESGSVNGDSQRTRRTFGGGGPVDKKLAVLDEDLLYGETAVASVWSAAGANIESDTGENITVRDWLLEEDKKLEGGSRIVAEKFNGRWYVVQSRECAVDQ